MSSFNNPQSYEDWLKEMDLSGKPQEIIYAANEAGKRQPNKKKLLSDVALVLATMYKRDMVRANDRPMVARAVKEKYEDVTRVLFPNTTFDSLYDFVLKNVPAHLAHNFDKHYTTRGDDIESRLGFVKAETTVSEDGEVRTPLGFISKPKPRLDKQGHRRPGLGFLND